MYSKITWECIHTGVVFEMWKEGEGLFILCRPTIRIVVWNSVRIEIMKPLVRLAHAF